MLYFGEITSVIGRNVDYGSCSILETISSLVVHCYSVSQMILITEIKKSHSILNVRAKPYFVFYKGQEQHSVAIVNKFCHGYMYVNIY